MTNMGSSFSMCVDLAHWNHAQSCKGDSLRKPNVLRSTPSVNISFKSSWDSMVTSWSLLNILKISVHDCGILIDPHFTLRRRDQRLLRDCIGLHHLATKGRVSLGLNRLVLYLSDSFLFKFCSSWFQRASAVSHGMRLKSGWFLKPVSRNRLQISAHWGISG